MEEGKEEEEEKEEGGGGKEKEGRKKRRLGCTQAERCHVKRPEDGHRQTKERGLRRIPTGQHLHFGLLVSKIITK